MTKPANGRSRKGAAVADKTAREHPAVHLESSQWRSGQSGNPKGRPRSARNKLSEKFIGALCDDFVEHGIKAIETVRETRPDVYLKVIAQLIPAELNLTTPINSRPSSG